MERQLGVHDNTVPQREVRNMKRTPVIYVYGVSDTGKTRLVERLLLMLIQKGRRVGTVKMSRSQQLDFDMEGKDTQRHIKAGSMITAASSLSNAVVFIPKRQDVHHLIEMMSITGDLDLVIVEGMGDDVPETSPKVAVGEVKGRVPGTIMELPDAEGSLEGLYHLVDRIMAKFEPSGEADQVVLRVGGDDVQIKGFVRDYLEGTIRGAVGALKEAGDPLHDAIEVSIPEHKGPVEMAVQPPRSLDID
jgi:molybdopterin-guanine dinucleotide biosynthesis protein MobB